MKHAGPLTLEPRRSRWALGLAWGAFLATAGLVVCLPLPDPAQAAAVAAIVFAALRLPAGLAGAPGSARLVVGLDRRITVVASDGRRREGTVRGDTYVGGRLVTLVWRPDGARWSQTLLIAADSLAPDVFRSLRVVLRYARVASVPSDAGTGRTGASGAGTSGAGTSGVEQG